MVRREFEQELKYLSLDQGPDGVVNYIEKGFVPNMRVPGVFYANDAIRPMLLDELRGQSGASGRGGFLPALKQIANVASLPGILKYSIGLPDCHAGYGFAIGNVAAMDMDDPEAVVSPGGVGFDICCGVRLIRTNLSADDIAPYVEKLTSKLYELIPVGVGRRIGVPLAMSDLNDILRNGMGWAVKNGYATNHDREHVEERGCVAGADPDHVSDRAKERGLGQLGTLGAGNHYCEVQQVQKIYDAAACHAMGINDVGQVCVMIHSGSRGLGHQVCTDYIQSMKPYRTKYDLNDQQLTCAPIRSSQGEKYLSALAGASNFAFCNRSAMTTMVRRAFASVLDRHEREMEMRVVYDVAHNTAKVETHQLDGRDHRLLVHRKGATRAFPAGHPKVPNDYMNIGQPVLIGGSMGSASYVLTGTEYGMQTTFGSTCHGAGRVLSRHQARSAIKARDTLAGLKAKGVTIKVGNARLVSEEDAASYKDVDEVVNTCESAKISRRAARLVPIAVIKG